jgi:hypothetical protein
MGEQSSRVRWVFGGIVGGFASGAFASFPMLIVWAGAYAFVHRLILTDWPQDPAPVVMLHFNMGAFAVWCAVLLSLAFLVCRERMRALCFLGAAIVAFPIPSILLFYWWSNNGHF